MSGVGNDHLNYMPVQRIARACDACRRKKSRCTGERPTCAHCRRLRIDCTYPTKTHGDDGRARDRPRPGSTISSTISATAYGDKGPTSHDTSNGASPLDLITTRLARIEDSLAEIKIQLQENQNCCAFHVERRYRVNAHPSHTSGKRRCVPLNRYAHDHNDTELASSVSPLPEEAPLANEVLLAVVDTYFTYCHNQPYSFFHEGNFRRRLAQGSVPKHLILAVLAGAVRFSSHPYFAGRTRETAVEYANQSWKSVVSSCFTTNQAADIHVVQTIASLALFDFTAGKSRHGSAWVKIGMAVRIAQDLRLMLDTAAHLPRADQEERRRVFWSVYLLDRLVSCGRGRPPAILDASCQLQLPCPEQIWKEGFSKKTLTLDELFNRTLQLPEPQGDFAYVIAMAYNLGRAAQYMLQELGIRSRYPPWDPSSDFAAIESDLLHLETQLNMHKSIYEVLLPHLTSPQGVDQQCTGPIIFSRMLFHLCYCMLNHPFLLRRRIEIGQHMAPASFLSRAFNTAWEHARHMMELIRNCRSASCVAQSSFNGYCVIVAGSIVALQVHCEDSHISSSAQVLLREAIEYLEYGGHFWQNVSNMATILRQLADNTMAFRQLSSDRPQISALSPADIEIMWTVVDYSTVSNEALAGITQDQSPDPNLMFDSWFDLFGAANDLSDVALDGEFQ